MSQTLVYLLLFVGLVLPVPAVIVLRLLGGRLGERAALVGAVLLFGLSMMSILVLARADVPLLRVGNLTLLLAGTRPAPAANVPPDIAPVDEPILEGPPELPTLTPRPSATPAPTATATASPTPEATVTPEATATPEATSTPEPAAGPRSYTVVQGDTFRAIAERFGVTVEVLLEANDLTPAQADSLRVGQELIIP